MRNVVRRERVERVSWGKVRGPRLKGGGGFPCPRGLWGAAVADVTSGLPNL